MHWYTTDILFSTAELRHYSISHFVYSNRQNYYSSCIGVTREEHIKGKWGQRRSAQIYANYHQEEWQPSGLNNCYKSFKKKIRQPRLLKSSSIKNIKEILPEYWPESKPWSKRSISKTSGSDKWCRITNR